MRRFHVLVALGWAATAGLGPCPAGGGDDPPPARTQERQDKLKERDRWAAEAARLLRRRDLGGAIAAGQRQLAIEREVLGNDHDDVVRSLEWLAQRSIEQDDLAAAREALREVLDIFTRRPAPAPWDLADARVNLANIDGLARLPAGRRRQVGEADFQLRTAGRLDQLDKTREAVELAAKALEVRRRLLGIENRHHAEGLVYQAFRYGRLGEFRRAEDAMTQARDIYARVLGREHRDYAVAVNGLGGLAFGQKDYARAEECFRQSLTIRRKVLGERHETYANNVQQLSDVYDRMVKDCVRNGDFNGARATLTKALAHESDCHGADHWRAKQVRAARAHLDAMAKLDAAATRRADEAADLLARAEAFRKAERLPAAIEAADKALAIRREVLGAESPATIDCLNTLARLHDEGGQIGRAGQRREEARRAMRAVYGTGHPDYQRCLERLADGYELFAEFSRGRGEFPLARQAYKEVLALKTERYGAGHWRLTSTRLRLDMVDRLAKATPDQRRRLSEAQDKVQAIADALGDGQPRDLLAALQKAVAAFDDLKWRDCPEYATGVLGLGRLNEILGHYAQAEKHYEQARALREALLGKGHPHYAQCLNNLGTLAQKLGDTDRAEALLQESLRIEKETRGETGAAYASTLSNLGTLYLAARDYDRAEPLLRDAVRLLAEEKGDVPGDYARALNNLAGVYEHTGDEDLAEPLYREASAIWKKLGDMAQYARSLDNRAGLLARAGRGDEVEPLYQEAQGVFKTVLGAGHPDYAISLINLAVWHAAAGRAADAAAGHETALRALRTHVGRVLPGLSEAEQLAFLGTVYQQAVHGSLAFALAGGNDRDLAARSAGWVLNAKAVTQQALAERTLLTRVSGDKELGAAAVELQAVRTRLAALTYRLPQPGQEESQREQLAKLTAQDRQLAKTIGRAVGRPDGDDPWLDLAAIRNAIPADAVLVEIARFDNWAVHATRRRREPPHYAAWVIPPAGDVRLIDLGPAAAVDDAVAQVRQAFHAAAATIGRKGEAAAERDLRAPMNDLARRVLVPLLESIGGRKQWILSPDADLWLVPWAALPLPDGRYAVEAHRIRLVVSGRDLVRRGEVNPSDPPLILADPDYDLDPDRPAARLPAPNPVLVPSDSGPSRWGRLAGTAAEARAIKPLIKDCVGREPRVYERERALEGTFKAAVRPSVVVLSTHGFFLGDQDLTVGAALPGGVGRGLQWVRPRVPPGGPRPAPRDRPPENPLNRCGLVLAGANTKDRAGDSRPDDGLLTGLEIVGTDLRGSELVVLSACDTGVGAVHPGEGVAGLRQAFQLAGARAVAATLWKIPDDETAVLMTRFFGRLAADRDPAAALAQAQRDAIEDRRARLKAAHPFYWAAFTVTGPPAPSRPD